jgi:DNA-binding IclR family transcriptional regulator
MPAGALERAVALLGRLGDRPGLTVPELAGAIGMPTSTAYRLLAELEQHGFVQRGAGRTVTLGTRLVALGRTAEAGLRTRLVAPAAPVMASLSAAVGETVILTAPCGLEAIVLHAVETERHSVRLSYPLFRRAPIHRGASGKALAAFLEPAERARLIAAVGGRGARGPGAAGPDAPGPGAAGADGTGPDGLERELDAIRAVGYAYTEGELDEGAAAAAAPVAGCSPGSRSPVRRRGSPWRGPR